MLTYEDYLRLLPGAQSGGSENYGPATPMGRQQWEAQNDAGRWGSVDNTVDIQKGDPRYAGLFSQLGGEAGRGISLNYTGGKPTSDVMVKPGSQQVSKDGWTALKDESWTPYAQDAGPDNGWKMALAALIAMGTAGAGSGLLGGMAGGADTLAAAAGQGFGTAGGAAGAGGMSGAGLMGGLGYEGAGMIAPGMEGLAAAESAAINAGTFGGAAGSFPEGFGGLDPETASGFGGGGSAGGGTPWDGSFGSGGGLDPETAAGFGGGGSAPASGGGLMEMIQRGGSGLLEWGMKNPLQALSLLQTGAGLLGGSGGGSGGSGGGGSGNPITLPKGNRGAFQGNPFTQQQIQNFKYTGGR